MKSEDIVSQFSEIFQKSQIIDLSHRWEEHMPVYPAHCKYFHNLWRSYWHGEASTMYQLVMSEHTGTHVDAPAHFVRDSHPAHIWMDKVSLGKLIGPCLKIDFLDQPQRSLVSKQQLQAWERTHAPVKKDYIVIFNFGWYKHWQLRPHQKFLVDYPGLSKEAAEYLIDAGVKAVGTDALSLDAYGTKEYPAHYTFLSAEVAIMENIANLDKVPTLFFFIALPLKIKDGSGSPIRAIAFIEK